MAQPNSGAATWPRALAVAAAVAFIIGPAIAYGGVVPAMGGFVLFGLGGLLALIATVAAIIIGVRGRWGAAMPPLIIGGAVFLAFLAIAIPGRKYPPINDITTDPANPPQFVRATTLEANRNRDMSYPGASFTEQQRAGYPDLRPLTLPVPPDEAFRRVESAAKQMSDWEITRNDTTSHALEGVATSRLFHFKDDFVIEVRPQDGSSVVQMRSKSRDGKGDIGANAARIRAFYARLQ